MRYTLFVTTVYEWLIWVIPWYNSETHSSGNKQESVSESEVKVLLSHVWLFVTSMDYSPPVSFVHGILQGRLLEWVAIPSSGGSSWPMYQTQVSCTADRFFTIWATNKHCNSTLVLCIRQIVGFRDLIHRRRRGRRNLG